MGQRVCNSDARFPFHEIYTISFVNKFDFVNYIIRCKNIYDNTCIRNIQSANTTWDELIEKTCRWDLTYLSLPINLCQPYLPTYLPT